MPTKEYFVKRICMKLLHQLHNQSLCVSSQFEPFEMVDNLLEYFRHQVYVQLSSILDLMEYANDIYEEMCMQPITNQLVVVVDLVHFWKLLLFARHLNGEQIV